MVGAKSSLLNVDSSHQEGVRLFELALSGKSGSSTAAVQEY